MAGFEDGASCGREGGLLPERTGSREADASPLQRKDPPACAWQRPPAACCLLSASLQPGQHGFQPWAEEAAATLRS